MSSAAQTRPGRHTCLLQASGVLSGSKMSSILVKNISFHTFLGPLSSSFALFIVHLFLFITGPTLTASLPSHCETRSVFYDVRSYCNSHPADVLLSEPAGFYLTDTMTRSVRTALADVVELIQKSESPVSKGVLLSPADKLDISVSGSHLPRTQPVCLHCKIGIMEHEASSPLASR